MLNMSIRIHELHMTAYDSKFHRELYFILQLLPLFCHWNICSRTLLLVSHEIIWSSLGIEKICNESNESTTFAHTYNPQQIESVFLQVMET